MKESKSREDLIVAFLSALSQDELKFTKDWIESRISSLPNAISLPKKITILYGTETGNAKKIANDFAILSKKSGIIPKVVGADTYKITDLPKEEYFFVVISTQGEGEPPLSAKKFYDYLKNNTQKFPKLNYAVLGLGDTMYPLFCQTGIDIDTFLENAGAKRLHSLIKADIDFKSISEDWMGTILKILSSQNISTEQGSREKSSAEVKTSYIGKVRYSVNLNDNKSEKKTFHIELESENAIQYKSGDIAVILPQNNPSQVEELIAFTRSDPEKIIQLSKKTGNLKEILLTYTSITYLSENVIKKIEEILSIPIKESRSDLIDIVKKYNINSPEKLESIIKVLNLISPRQYSIASSNLVNDTELHLTVALDTFTVGNIVKFGLCSQYLCNLEEGDSVPFSIKKNPHFYLPSPEKDIIMIGPGTGIAPFRAFVAERNVIQAEGRNWLFFGDRKFTENFLYQTEWQEHFAMGTLTKINLAWSRDGKEKYYVQDEIRKEGKELFEWLENGAYLYICGAKDPMSLDVEKAIIDVIATQKKVSQKKAKSYLEKLEQDHRYLKDVY